MWIVTSTNDVFRPTIQLYERLPTTSHPSMRVMQQRRSTLLYLLARCRSVAWRRLWGPLDTDVHGSRARHSPEECMGSEPLSFSSPLPLCMLLVVRQKFLLREASVTHLPIFQMGDLYCREDMLGVTEVPATAGRPGSGRVIVSTDLYAMMNHRTVVADQARSLSWVRLSLYGQVRDPVNCGPEPFDLYFQCSIGFLIQEVHDVGRKAL